MTAMTAMTSPLGPSYSQPPFSEDAREENPDERVLDVIDALPAGMNPPSGQADDFPAVQEPVLPDMRHDDRDDEEDDGEQRSRSSLVPRPVTE